MMFVLLTRGFFWRETMMGRIVICLATLLLLVGCTGTGKEVVDTGGQTPQDTKTDAVQDAGVEPEMRGGDGAAVEDGLETPDGQPLPEAVEPDGVPEDVQPPDVVPLDVVPIDLEPADVEPEYTPQENAGFRLDTLVMTEPVFCYMMGDLCLPVLDMVNGTLGDAVAEGELNVLGVFEPFGPGQTVTLTLGQADCDQDLGACGYQEGVVPAVYEEVQVSTAADCASADLVYEAPCFATGEADLALDFAGIVLGLSNVTAAGTLVSWPPDGEIFPGLIHGYLPEEIAKTVQVQIPAGEMPIFLTLYELLENSETQPQEVDGHLAWPVSIEFTAAQVDIL